MRRPLGGGFADVQNARRGVGRDFASVAKRAARGRRRLCRRAKCARRGRQELCKCCKVCGEGSGARFARFPRSERKVIVEYSSDIEVNLFDTSGKSY